MKELRLCPLSTCGWFPTELLTGCCSPQTGPTFTRTASLPLVAAPLQGEAQRDCWVFPNRYPGGVFLGSLSSTRGKVPERPPQGAQGAGDPQARAPLPLPVTRPQRLYTAAVLVVFLLEKTIVPTTPVCACCRLDVCISPKSQG